MEFENLQIEVPIDEDPSQSQMFGVKIYEKKYHNKSKDFVIGFNPSSKEFLQRKSNRAKRFGIDREKTKESETEIPDDMSQFMNIDIKSLQWPPVPAEANEEIRHDAVLVYGVQDMSTKDVFQYFSLYGPETLEWIDDFSCNVVWDKDKSVTEAMDNLSKTYTMLCRLKNGGTSGNEASTNSTETITVKDEDVDDEVEEVSSNIILLEDEEICPKDIWRIALPYQTSQLFFRPATVKDKKLPGASERSEYYLKYGKSENIKQNGVGGVISKSRKRKLERMRHTAEMRFKSNQPDVTLVDLPQLKKEENAMDLDDEAPKIKRLNVHDTRANQMSMVADKVQVRQKLGVRYTDESIHDRLGNPFLDNNTIEDNSDHICSNSDIFKRLGEGIHNRLGDHRNNGPDVRREIESSKQNRNKKHMTSLGYEDDDGVYHDIYRASDVKSESVKNVINSDNVGTSSRNSRRNQRSDRTDSKSSESVSVTDLRDKLKRKNLQKKQTSSHEDNIKIETEAQEKLNLCIEIKQEVSDVDMVDEDFEF